MTTTSAPARAEARLRAIMRIDDQYEFKLTRPGLRGEKTKPPTPQPLAHSLGLLVTLGDGGGVDVADISSDTGSTPDIVQAQSGDQGVGLEQQAQWLTDPTAGTEDGDLALGSGGRGEGSDGSLESGSGEHFVGEIRQV